MSNAGPSDAQTVALSDLVPANTTFVSDAQTSGPAFNLTSPSPGGSGTIIGTIGTLASGASASFTVMVMVSPSTPRGATIVNTANVTAATSDLNLANNTQTVTTDVTPPVPVPLPSPSVIDVQRFGVHVQPTVLVVTFSMPLDSARALNAANYRIVTLGGPGRGGSKKGHVTQVRKAVYDPAARTVTLHMAQQMDLHNFYRITITGTAAGGLMGTEGAPLDGVGTTTPGSNFVGRDFVEVTRWTVRGGDPNRPEIGGTRAASRPRPLGIGRRRAGGFRTTQTWVRRGGLTAFGFVWNRFVTAGDKGETCNAAPVRPLRKNLIECMNVLMRYVLLDSLAHEGLIGQV